MTTQSEQTLENNLIAQMVDMNYERVAVYDEANIMANFRPQRKPDYERILK